MMKKFLILLTAGGLLSLVAESFANACPCTEGGKAIAAGRKCTQGSKGCACNHKNGKSCKPDANKKNDLKSAPAKPDAQKSA